MPLKLLSTLILFVISFQAMAFEGKGFKIVSEKVTQSDGFKGGFQKSGK